MTRRGDLRKRLRWPVLVYWGVLLGGLWLFFELADEVYEREGFFFDAPLLTLFYDLQSPALTGVMSLLTQLGSIHVLAALSLLTAVLLRRFWRREALFFGLSVAGAGGLILFVKGFLARPRPDLFEPLMHTGSFSFPSGHSLGTAAFLSSLALVWWRRSPRYRLPFAVFAALAALGVGLSRVYLQVHYPSDVLAGWLLGLAWVLGLNAWFGGAAAGRPD